MPSNFIFSDSSILHTYMTLEPDHKFHWGDLYIPLLSNSQVIISTIGPISTDTNWNYSTLFIDTDSDTINYNITTENYTNGKSPFQFHFKINSSAPAGDYSLKIFFTYYNSVEWKTSQESIALHVNSWTEEHAKLTVILGLLIGILTLIGIIPVIIQGSNYVRRKLFKTHSSQGQHLPMVNKIPETKTNITSSISKPQEHLKKSKQKPK